MEFRALLEELGQIDVYLLDQAMKGRLAPPMRILDAGCGGGRNLELFLRAGFEAHGVDASPEAIDKTRALARKVAPGAPAERFAVSSVEKLPFADGYFDAVVCIAVLHFAEDDDHFGAMLTELWRTLRPGGLFFARLASSIGLEARVKPISGRRHHLPDGTDRYLVDEAALLDHSARLGGRLIEPIKTVNVQNLRAMTTWVLEKGGVA